MTGVPAYRVGWIVIVAATFVAALVLRASGMTLVLSSFFPMVSTGLILVCAHFFYRHRSERRLSLVTGVFAMLIASSLLAAIISHAGLRMGYPWIDAWLSDADNYMGFDTPQLAMSLAADFGIGGMLKVFYNSAFPMTFVAALWLSLSGQDERTWELGCCFAVTIIVASCCAVLFPAIGSMVYHEIDGDPSLPIGAGNFHLSTVEYFRGTDNPEFDMSRVNGIVTFPSFHMVMAILVPYALRGVRIAFPLALLWSLFVGLATIGIGGHYMIDLIAGAGLWGLIAWRIRLRDRPVSMTDRHR